MNAKNNFNMKISISHVCLLTVGNGMVCNVRVGACSHNPQEHSHFLAVPVLFYFRLVKKLVSWFGCRVRVRVKVIQY